MAETFLYRKPPIGRARPAVSLDDDNLTLKHPMLKAPISVPLGQLAAVVRMTQTEGGDPLLRRDARILAFQMGHLGYPNVAIVFAAPVRVDRFKFGSPNVLGISGQERRRGIDIDGVRSGVEEPDQLVDSLARRGVRRVETLAEALRQVVGEPMGQDAVQRRQELSRRRLRSTAKLVIWGVVWTILMAVQTAFRVFDDDVAPEIASLVASSIAWSAVVALVVKSVSPVRTTSSIPVPGPITEPRRLSGRKAIGLGIGFVAAIMALVGVPILLAYRLNSMGVPTSVAYGLVGGVPGGALMGIGLRTLAASRSSGPGAVP
ncbi:MAG: hypothetical protein ACT4OS_06220 [Acidimicrobiales bacterium]